MLITCNCSNGAACFCNEQIQSANRFSNKISALSISCKRSVTTSGHMVASRGTREQREIYHSRCMTSLRGIRVTDVLTGVITRVIATDRYRRGTALIEFEVETMTSVFARWFGLDSLDCVAEIESILLDLSGGEKRELTAPAGTANRPPARHHEERLCSDIKLNPTLGLTWSAVRRRGNGNDSTAILTARTYTHPYTHTSGFFLIIEFRTSAPLFFSPQHNVYMRRSIDEVTEAEQLSQKRYHTVTIRILTKEYRFEFINLTNQPKEFHFERKKQLLHQV